MKKISGLYHEMNQAIERWRVQAFLVQWSQKEMQQSKLHQLELEKQDCTDKLMATEKRIRDISDKIAQNEDRRRKLEAICDQSRLSQEKEKLDSRRQALQEEQNRLQRELQTLAQQIQAEALRLKKLCGEILEQEADETLPPVQKAAQNVLDAYAFLAPENGEVFAHPLESFEDAQQAVAAFSGALRSAQHKLDDRLAEWNGQKDQKNAALANLRKNIKDYPRGLLQLKKRLAEELEHQTGSPVPIDILADVLEVADERWRGAVEGYLHTQKFYLLVDPAYYKQALSIFDRLKKEFGAMSFGLVDVGKLRERETIHPRDDSLAKKVETENPLARSYIDYLLGRVVCCETAQQLREFKTAITADGMLYQGYVARSMQRDRMENAFIGHRAVSLRISRLEEELAQIKAELGRWQPIRQLFAQTKEPLFTQFFVQNTIAEKQEAHRRCAELTGEIAEVDAQLSKTDFQWLEEQQDTIKALQDETLALNREKDSQNTQVGQLKERLRQLDDELLPEQHRQLKAMQDRLAETFSREYQERVGIPRYQEEFARLKRAEVVCKQFSGLVAQSEQEQDAAKKKLFAARREYADRFKYYAFHIESMDNEEYAAEQRRLEESELPQYHEKIKTAQESALEQFQNDFLAKLKSSIDQVQTQVKNLNRALRHAQFGTDRYQFRVERNPDYAEYYDMIMAPELMEGDVGLFALPFQNKYGQLIEKLFSQITMADDTQLNARQQSELQENIQRYTDFRTYLKFDLETTDQNGTKQLLSQTLNTKSGGETQTPFYIAVLASFAQLYRVNDPSVFGNTVRLVVFDEAFNKMDSERIIESVRLLRKMRLQAIICTPPDKVADIMPIADRTLLVNKDKYQMHILTFGKEIAQ